MINFLRLDQLTDKEHRIVNRAIQLSKYLGGKRTDSITPLKGAVLLR